jgi:hypothetical protein
MGLNRVTTFVVDDLACFVDRLCCMRAIEYIRK